jgi:hypothetical protein
MSLGVGEPTLQLGTLSPADVRRHVWIHLGRCRRQLKLIVDPRQTLESLRVSRGGHGRLRKADRESRGRRGVGEGARPLLRRSRVGRGRLFGRKRLGLYPIR